MDIYILQNSKIIHLKYDMCIWAQFSYTSEKGLILSIIKITQKSWSWAWIIKDSMIRDATPKWFRKIFRLWKNLIITTFIINTSIYSMLAQHGPGFLQKQLLVLFCLILTTTPEAISYYYSCFWDWGVRDIKGLKPALGHTDKRQQMQDLNSTVCVLKLLYVAFRTRKMALKGCFSTGFFILVYKDRIRNNDISLKVLYFAGPTRISQICGLLEGNHKFKVYVENGTWGLWMIYGLSSMQLGVSKCGQQGAKLHKFWFGYFITF